MTKLSRPFDTDSCRSTQKHSPGLNQHRSAGEVITASAHVSGARRLSSFLQHLPEDIRALLYELRYAKIWETLYQDVI